MRPSSERVASTSAEKRELLAYPYEGFWRNMDTFKDKVELDEIIQAGDQPWQLWAQQN
jgi:glucose-1-phosphate cytidylyltransferase